ncbi:hypothetical protein I4U23_015212 [Adineta vaga]|nr:hypothetical protein I4U23_015212 [Adineta vaga]
MRIIRQKHRLHQIIEWRKFRRMTLQLLSLILSIFIQVSLKMSFCCDDGHYPLVRHHSAKVRSSRAIGSTYEVAAGESRSTKDKFSVRVPTAFGTVKINESHARRSARASRVKASRFAAASDTLYNGILFI